MTARKAAAKKASPAAAARKDEADEDVVVIEHCGIKLRIPVRGKRPIAAIDAFRRGDNYEGNRRMLGDEQWKLLSDAGMTLEELDALGEKLNAALGN